VNEHPTSDAEVRRVIAGLDQARNVAEADNRHYHHLLRARALILAQQRTIAAMRHQDRLPVVASAP
jgi:hypothetical protein